MNNHLKTILIVEDEKSIRELLQLNLEMDDFKVISCSRGDEVVGMINATNINLIILDVMLPGKNGIEVCRDIRQMWPEIPIIMLSALEQSKDKIEGLKAGADDYIGKPFNYEELHLRIQKQLEKSRSQLGLKNHSRINGLQVDFTSNYIIHHSGDKKEMSSKESALLQYLLNNKNRVVSRREILANVWGYDHFPNSRTVDNHIASLRKLLDSSGQSPIKSERGIGYQLIID